MLFQDLSQITLIFISKKKKCRALHPLLDKLREIDLRYTWCFPVCSPGEPHAAQITISRGSTGILQLELIDLPEWYQEFCLPPMERSMPSPLFTSPDNRSSKKMKASHHGGSQAGSQAGTSNLKSHSSKVLDEYRLRRWYPLCVPVSLSKGS